MATKYRKCDKCDSNGRIYNPETESATTCPCQLKPQQNELLKIALEKSGLPQFIFPNQLMSTFDSKVQYKGKKSKENITNLNKYITNFENTFKWHNLYFWGVESITQKTTTACWVGKELLKQGFEVVFIQCSSLVELLVAFKQNANHCLYADFLIIDNLTKLNELQISKFKSFLEERRRATCFISNLPIYKLKTIFNTSIESILKKSLVMEFKDIVPPIDYENFDSIWDE